MSIRDDQIKNLTAIADRILTRLKADKTLIIRIEGHASPEGSTRERHQELSEQRALAVRNFICGIIKDPQLRARIRSEGFGETRPIYPVDSDLNPENRRVEIRGGIE